MSNLYYQLTGLAPIRAVHKYLTDTPGLISKNCVVGYMSIPSGWGYSWSVTLPTDVSPSVAVSVIQSFMVSLLGNPYSVDSGSYDDPCLHIIVVIPPSLLDTHLNKGSLRLLANTAGPEFVATLINSGFHPSEEGWIV